MKYKWWGISSVIIAVILCVVMSSLVLESEDRGRVHQHLEAQPKQSCEAHQNGEFCSHLPIVVIKTDGKEIPGNTFGVQDRFGELLATTTLEGEKMQKASIMVYDNANENNHLTDEPAIKTDILIRVRGHASREFEKKPYLIKFVDENGLDNELSVMGMEAHSEWALNGPYLDKSLVRNYMFYNLAGDLMDYAPNVRYCELFVDNDYRGIYLMLETISNGNDCRLDLIVNEKDNKLVGYLCKLDRVTEEDVASVRGIYPLSERTNYTPSDMSLRYPGKNSLTPELAKEIELEISRFDKVVTSYDYDSNNYGYQHYVEMNNIVDYFIINEFTKNMDAGRYSTYIYKRPGEKYKFCVWDFNNACDNFPEDVTGYEDFSVHAKPYFIAFCRDERFTETVIERYKALRQTYLSDEYLSNYIDQTVAFLGAAVDRNSQRWSSYITSSALVPYERNTYSQAEAVLKLKDWLFNRGQWLDDNIETLLQYSAESKVKKYNEVTE